MNQLTLRENMLHPNRLLYALVFAVAFVIIGNGIPYAYYHYFDKTQYIEVLEPISFDRKIYQPCDEQRALTKIRILISAPVKVNSRLYLMKTNSQDETEVIKEYNIDTFLQKQAEPQLHTTTTPLPCDLKPGVYFFRGIFQYKIHEVARVAPFTSEQFTIEEPLTNNTEKE